jgi:hypothetical protein
MSDIIEHNFQYIRISNLDRKKGTPSAFTCTCSNEPNLSSVTHIYVDSVSLPNVFYNITSDNNTWEFLYNVSTVSVTVDPGFYSANQLIGVLKSLIDPIISPDTITLTLNQFTSKITAVFSNPLATIQTIETNPNSKMSPNLGITSDSPSNVDTFTFQDIPDLSGPRMIFLHCQDICGSKTTITENFNVSTFCSIPVEVPYLSNIHYKSTSSRFDLIHQRDGKNLTKLDIRIRDSRGKILELGNNHEMVIVLKVFY